MYSYLILNIKYNLKEADVSILIELITIEESVYLSPNYFGPNFSPLEMERSYTMAS